MALLIVSWQLNRGTTRWKYWWWLILKITSWRCKWETSVVKANFQNPNPNSQGKASSNSLAGPVQARKFSRTFTYLLTRRRISRCCGPAGSLGNVSSPISNEQTKGNHFLCFSNKSNQNQNDLGDDGRKSLFLYIRSFQIAPDPSVSCANLVAVSGVNFVRSLLSWLPDDLSY